MLREVVRWGHFLLFEGEGGGGYTPDGLQFYRGATGWRREQTSRCPWRGPTQGELPNSERWGGNRTDSLVAVRQYTETSGSRAIKFAWSDLPACLATTALLCWQ